MGKIAAENQGVIWSVLLAYVEDRVFQFAPVAESEMFQVPEFMAVAPESYCVLENSRSVMVIW